MPRINYQELEQSALAKMPSGWVTRAELDALLTPSEVQAVALHSMKERTLFKAKVTVPPENPVDFVLYYQKVEGGQ